MSGAVFTLGNSVSGSLGLGDALSKFGRVAVTGLTIEQDPDTVNSYLTTRYAGLSAVTSGGVTTFLNPSLVVIPSAYNNGIVYSLHSKQVNTGDFTVTRNTEARRVNSAGQIASIGSGLPRLDYLTSGGTVGTPALLVEPAATNLALQSQDFLTTWAPTNIAVTTGSTAAFTAPDGTTTADLLTASASGSARIIQSFTFVSGTTYTYSAFAKAGSGFFGLTMENGGVASGAAVVWNLNTGALAVSGAVGAGYTLQSQGIENYGNGWYRCRMTVLLSLGAAGNIRANTSDGTMTSAIINSASGNTAYVWGAQIETGSVATSYIPTTAGTGSRSADVISVTGAVSGSIGQTEGTIYAEVDIRSFNNTGILATISDGTASNLLTIYKFTDSKIYFDRTSATQSATTTAGSSGTYTAPTILKIAIGYKSGETRMYINGVAVTAEQTATFTFGTLTKVNIGSSRFDGTFFNDRIRAVALYTTRLTNQQLQLLTAL
jgi:hypothetical protein